MPEDRPYIEENARQLERLRALIDGMDEDDLRTSVNEYWSVAGVLGHVAFWDARVLRWPTGWSVGCRSRRRRKARVTIRVDQRRSRPLIHAIPPMEMAALALELAEQTDRSVATMPLDRMWPTDPTSPLNPSARAHRGEHLDEMRRSNGGDPSLRRE
jgi:hypothetical protein